MDNITRVRDVYIGKPDARDEVTYDGFENFLKSFVMPPNFDIDGILKGDKCFIRGYKGTGKTALLFYLHNKMLEKDASACLSFIFFKEQYRHVERKKLANISANISKSIDISREILIDEQDFEYIWKWVFYKQFIEDNIRCNYGIFENDGAWSNFENTVNRILSKRTNSSLFKLTSKLKLSLDYQEPIIGGKVSPALELDFDNKNNNQEYLVFIELIDKATKCFSKLKKTDIPYYIFIDELEAFYADKTVLQRDLRMIRDLIIVIKQFNLIFKNCGFHNVKFIASIRTEIINSINRFVPAKEINKITSGFEAPLIWDYNNTNSYAHPIIEVLLKRIEIAENRNGVYFTKLEDIYKKWFPVAIDKVEPASFILNNSWSKPRDIVRFLTAAKNCLESNSTSYNQAVCSSCLQEYSRESLKEVTEEMGALYSPEEIDIIFSCLRGYKTLFSLEEIKSRVSKLFPGTILNNNLMQILKDLYRLGIIGNYSKFAKQFQFQHKGNDGLLLTDDWLISVHRALQKALSLSIRRDWGSNYNYKVTLNTGDSVLATVVKIVPGYLLVSFVVDGCEYSGSINISQLSTQWIDDIFSFANVGDQFEAKILKYDTSRRKWNLTLIP